MATHNGTHDVFVLALNEFNRTKLERLPEAEECRFHGLLTMEESHGAHEYDVDTLMERAIQRLEESDAPVDAIVQFWDFPISIMHSILSERFGTPGPSPQSVLRCEQKHWSRIKQREVIPDLVPPFQGFNPFADDPRSDIDMDYPFWVKPVKSFAGHLGFRVESDADLDRAIATMRRRVERFTEPLAKLIAYTQPPEEFPDEDPCLCIAEGIIDGSQCTVEGYAYDGQIDIHGVIDSHRFPGTSTFSHYQYPSALPSRIADRMREASRTVMAHVGFDSSAFNIEYFWDRENDNLWLLEINPRVSQSHADLFEKVDGAPNTKVPLDVALGRKPAMPKREGAYNVAGKFFVRRFENGIVRSAPGEEELQRVKEAIPGIHVDLQAKEGQRLDELDYQDSYSYKLAFLYFGGDSEEDLQSRFQLATEILGYEVEPIEESE